MFEWNWSRIPSFSIKNNNIVNIGNNKKTTQSQNTTIRQKMARKRFDNATKLWIVAQFTTRHAQGESLQSIAVSFGVQATQLKKWQQQIKFLDTLKAHISNQTTTKLEELGIQPYIIPGGCTSLCQPCDIGINKPFKDRLRAQWWQWVVEQGVQRSVFDNPKREQVGKWIEAAWNNVPADVVRNSWRLSDFDYFEEDKE